MFKKLNTLYFRISTQLCVSVARKLSEYFLQSRMSTRLRHTALSAWPLHYNKVSFDQEAASILFSAVQPFSVRTLCIDYPNFQSWEGGIEIQEAWMPSKKQGNRRAVRQRTAKGASHWMKQQGSKCTNQSCWKTSNYSRASCFIRSRMTSRPHHRKKTCSMQSKCRDQHHVRLHGETNEKLSFYCYSLHWITTTFFFLYFSRFLPDYFIHVRRFYCHLVDTYSGSRFFKNCLCFQQF